jgi:hypothetical protein
MPCEVVKIEMCDDVKIDTAEAGAAAAAAAAKRWRAGGALYA